jgi:hypothetical protein
MKSKPRQTGRKPPFRSLRSANGVRMDEMLVCDAGIDARKNPAPIMDRIKARLERHPVSFASRPLKPRRTGSDRT